MYKYFIALLLILSSLCTSAQADKKKSGTIKISKLKRDSVYLKADIRFSEFYVGSKKSKRPQIVESSQAISPSPKYNDIADFNFNLFLIKRINVDISDLGGKTTDTVRIQVKVLDNGKPYYKDLTPLLVLNGVPAVFDKKENAYKLDAIHYKCLNAVKNIEEWEPGYILLEKVDKFKGQTVIKAKKEKLIATGVLTIVFSTLPFEKSEEQ